MKGTSGYGLDPLRHTSKLLLLLLEFEIQVLSADNILLPDR